MDQDAATLAEAQLYMEWAFGAEMLRASLKGEVRRGSLTATAKQLQVKPATLRKFLMGGEASTRLWETGMALARDRPPPMVYAEAVGLNLIADWFPHRTRTDVRKALVDALIETCEARGLDVPNGLREAARPVGQR